MANQKIGPVSDYGSRANPTVRMNGLDANGEMRVEPGVEIDGFEQVFEMLKVADTVFRESLLKRLAVRDSGLARALRQRLAEDGV